MPLGFTRNSNRSQQALPENPQAQRGLSNNSSTTAVNQGGEDKEFEAQTQAQAQAQQVQQQQRQNYPQARNDLPPYNPANNGQAPSGRTYQEEADLPSRSQSHRHTGGFSIQPPSPVADPRGASVDDQALSDYQRSYNTAQSSRQQPPPAEHKKGKSARFFGAFSSKSSSRAEPSSSTPSDQQGQPNSHNNLGGIGRRISKRHRDPPPGFQPQGQSDLSEKHIGGGWQSGQSSESQLPSPHEGDEDDSGLDPYLIRQSDHQQPEAPQGQAHPLHQGVQPTIRLARVDPDPTVRVVDDSEQSPYQGQPLQLLTQQQPWLAQGNINQSPGSPASQQQSEYQHPQPAQYQTHSPNQAPPNLQFRNPQNPEVVSQLSRDSPVEDEDQRPQSVQSLNQAPLPAGSYAPAPQSAEYPPRGQSLHIQGPRPSQQAANMAPPSGQPPQSRRSTDVKQPPQGEARAPSGPPPGYSQERSFGSNTAAAPGNPLPPVPGQQPPGNYRGGSALQREYGQGGGEQGRNTPPLPADRDDPQQLLLVKYKKVKTLYFEKQAQVEQLQNTLANQRLSQSRTSLDDNEYASRFSRLDGAIKEFAFSIRKDWKTIPRWLMASVNQDAQKVGTKEMTAVGRATISRWIYDEIFMKCFHPSLEDPLSFQLKRIEQNLRSIALSSTQEEVEASISKVIQWKLATVEGIGIPLNSPDKSDDKMLFTQKAVTNLTAHLVTYLQDPAPPGIQGNATSIVELAVGIASHLPLESRDISITYPLPGDSITSQMKVDPTQLPAVDNPQIDHDDDSSQSSDPKDHDSPSESVKSEGGKLSKKQDKSKGIPQNGKKPFSSAGAESEGKPKDGIPRIRYAAFMGVEVRGRQYLINPTVWPLA